MRSHKLWPRWITDFKSPDIVQGMMDDTQDLTKMYEQMCGVTAERHMHKPPSNDEHDQEELMMVISATGATQDIYEDRLLRENKTASNWENIKKSGASADWTVTDKSKKTKEAPART